jgi:hypothetical protein
MISQQFRKSAGGDSGRALALRSDEPLQMGRDPCVVAGLCSGQKRDYLPLVGGKAEKSGMADRQGAPTAVA